MSKYSSIDTCFDDQDALVEALKADGFQPLLATDPVAGDPLTGYQGDKRKDRAHVIIPRQQIGGASNDIGFRRGTDGWLRPCCFALAPPFLGRLPWHQPPEILECRSDQFHHLAAKRQRRPKRYPDWQRIPLVYPRLWRLFMQIGRASCRERV